MQTTMFMLRPPLATVCSTSKKKILHSIPHHTFLVSTSVTSLSSKHHSSSNLDFSVFISRFFALTHVEAGEKNKRFCTVLRANSPKSSEPLFDADSPEKVVKRLESTARHFKRLGSIGFWGQLVFTSAAAVILAFSAVVTGKVTSPFTFYATAGGIVAGFISAFWSFGYIRLSERVLRSANDPSKAPPRADVVKSLNNGIGMNLLGMGSAVLGMQATVGLLVAKALTTSAVPNYSPRQNPVLALDVFLVQAVANTILSHFLGLLFSLELLRSVTQPLSNRVPLPNPA